MANKALPDNIYLDDIRATAKKLGKKIFSSGDYRRHGGYSASIGTDRWGSWAGALVAAGLASHEEEVLLYSKRQNVDRVKEAKKAIDHEKTIQALQRELEIAKGVKALPFNTHTIKPLKSSKNHEATAIAIASDWHVGELVHPRSLRVPGGSINEYNLDEAERRADEFWRKILVLVEIERSAAKVPRLILGLLGDFISGYIHPELEESNTLAPLRETEFAKKLIYRGIELLRKEGNFEEIIIPCIYGNHGRTTHKPRVSTGDLNSYEAAMYRSLEEIYTEFKPDKRIKFVVADGLHCYVEIYGLRLRFSHGDSIKYGGGVGGLTIPLNKAVDSWNSNDFQRADYDFMGHWHQLHNHGKVIVNGSLIGYSPYSLAIKARYERPQQAFAMLDGKYKCISSFRPIWVTDK